MSQSTKNRMEGKPSKPSADYPLFAHKNGQWAKKLGGKTVCFGPWHAPGEALVRYCKMQHLPLPELPAIPEPPEQDACPAKVTRRQGEKPGKPYETFPLTPDNDGQWAKRIRGHSRDCSLPPSFNSRWVQWAGFKFRENQGTSEKPQEIAFPFLSARVH